MKEDPRSRTSELLQCHHRDSGAIERLIPIIYSELRQIAGRLVAREKISATLQPTVLLHDACVRLLDAAQVGERGRTYFLAAAARAMRQILVERARSLKTHKHGGGLQRVTLREEAARGGELDFDVLALNEAIDELAAFSARQASIVELRFFSGLEVSRVAELLDVSERTVKADWRVARAWLKHRLTQSDEQSQ